MVGKLPAKLTYGLVIYGVFFSTIKFAFYLKNVILCSFLKNGLPSKRVISFFLNNLHLPMVEGIAFYALYKSRVLKTPYEADDICFLIGLPDEFKKSRLVAHSILKLSFPMFCGITLRKHYIMKATWSVIQKIAFSLFVCFWLKMRKI